MKIVILICKGAITVLLTVVFSCSTVYAQAPEKMSYQAVIRNSSNQLVVSKVVGMRISILQGSSNGIEVYSEIQTPTTNENGLVSILIGNEVGYSVINWEDGPYFIKTQTDPTGGTDYTIVGVSQLLSVPFALLSKRAETADYNTLLNKPTLFDGDYNSLINKPILFSGSFAELTNKPTTISGYGITDAFNGDYNSLSNKPTLFDGTWASLTGRPTFSTVATTGSFSDIVAKPTTLSGYGITDAFNGDYNSLSNKPTLFDGTWSSLTDKPNFSIVATSGSYNDLLNKPSGNNAGDIQYWNGSAWVLIPAGIEGQVLKMGANNIPSWQSFTSNPTATVLAATNLLMNSATLNGSVVANGYSTTVTFEYGTTTSYGNSITANPSPVSGYASISVSANINSLIANTTYHYRIKVSNAVNLVNSSDMTFTTTGQAPTVTTNASTGITTTGATLNGLVNANGYSTTTTFDYGTTISYGSSVTASQSPVSGNINTSVSVPISSLSPGTVYHFRVKGVNSMGTTYGNDLTFTTLGQTPTATSLAATNIISTGASLNGSVNANYLSTTVTFEWGTTTSYGNSVTASQSPVTGSTNTSVSASITGLTAGVTYHFRVKAVNSLGTSYGVDKQFTPALALGESYAGGYIFYLDGTGLHGLVCTTTDQSTGTDWGCTGTALTGADGTSLGTGAQNTSDIVSGCVSLDIAAKICNDLDLDGFTDWYLPSKDELGLIYTNLYSKGKGNISGVWYWSSSEYSADNAWIWQMDFGVASSSYNKSSQYYVRAVRSF